MSSTPVPVTHIECIPGTCGGRPRIAGTRIRVQDVAFWHENLGLSPDEIVFQYPHLALADVHAALGYFYDNRQEIEHAQKSDETFVEEFQARNPSKLIAKLTQRP